MGENIGRSRFTRIEERDGASAARHSLQPKHLGLAGGNFLYAVGENGQVGRVEAKPRCQKGSKFEHISSRVLTHGWLLLVEMLVIVYSGQYFSEPRMQCRDRRIGRCGRLRSVAPGPR